MSSSTAPRSRASARRGPAGVFATEWGLAILALVLAVLVWAVVYDTIATDTDPLFVEIELKTSPQYVARAREKAVLELRGPRGEIDKARQALGVPPRLEARIEDLPPGKDKETILLRREMVSFPFPTRIITSLGLPEAEVHRMREDTVSFEAPRLTGVPTGFDYRVTLEPAMSPVTGPAGKVGARIRPNPVDVASVFEGLQGDLVPPTQRIRLGFDDWRNDEKDRTYRAGVVLPEVVAVVDFFPTGRRKILNRVEYVVAEGFVVEPHEGEEDFDGDRFNGLFEGHEKDLQALEDAKANELWWYVVRVPQDKLPTATGETTDANLDIEFFLASSMDKLRVRFASRTSVLVTIRREGP